jgi:hypothetical protein
VQDEGRSAGDRAPGLADDSLGDTQSILPEVEREAEQRRRAEGGGEGRESSEGGGEAAGARSEDGGEAAGVRPEDGGRGAGD